MIDFLLYILLPIFAFIIFHDILFENKWLSGPIKLYKKSNEKLTMYTIKKYEGKYGSPSKPIESLVSFENFKHADEYIKSLPEIDKPGFVNFYAIDHNGKTILTFLGKEILSDINVISEKRPKIIIFQETDLLNKDIRVFMDGVPTTFQRIGNFAIIGEPKIWVEVNNDGNKK